MAVYPLSVLTLEVITIHTHTHTHILQHGVRIGCKVQIDKLSTLIYKVIELVHKTF